MTQHFGTRLAAAMAAAGPLCVGIDPHAHLLQAWGLPDTPEGVRRFSLTVLDAVAGTCAAVKPQAAFYERHGSAGMAVLEETLVAARERGLLTVLDVKRGDIGSTMGAYAEAYLGEGSPLAADSITVSPYLGYGSLRPALELARRTGRGLWVLALTSNAEGRDVQLVGEPTVAARVVAAVAEDVRGMEPFGDVGLVVGATLPRSPQELGVDLLGCSAPVLAPGVGAQGAGPLDVARTFAGMTERVLVPISRGVLAAGPDAHALSESARRWSGELAEALGGRPGSPGLARPTVTR